MASSIVRKALLPLLLLGTAMLGGCFYTPYPVYGGGYYAPSYGRPVVVAAPYYRGGYYR